MPPEFTVQPAEESDSSVFADWLFTSKLGLTVNRLLYKDWPNEDAQRAQYADAVAYGWRDGMQYHKAVDEQGRILGFLVLARKQAARDAQADKPHCPESMDAGVFETVMEATQKIAKVADREERYEIVYMYVKPSSRGIKVGTALLDAAKKEAKNEGLPLLVCAEPQSYEFFTRKGFKETIHSEFDLSQWAPDNSGFGMFRLAGLRWSSS